MIAANTKLMAIEIKPYLSKSTLVKLNQTQTTILQLISKSYTEDSINSINLTLFLLKALMMN